MKHEKFREMTLLDYTRRYNREEYDKIRPNLNAKKAYEMQTPVIILPTAADIKKSINDKFANLFQS